MKLKRRWLSFSAAGLVTVALFAGGNAPLQGAPRGETVYPTTRSVTPVVGGGDLSSGHALPPAVRERKYELLLERRAELAARQTFPVPDSSGEQAGHPTEVGTAKTRVHGNVNEFVIGRNNENTLADDAGVGSALAEPSAANDGVQVFYTGNTFASFSINGGSTWTKVAIPAGPASSPAPCCDQEVLYDQGRAITLWSVLYARDFDADDDFDNGNIRIIVRREIPAANSCSYVIDPDGAKPAFEWIRSALGKESLDEDTHDLLERLPEFGKKASPLMPELIAMLKAKPFFYRKQAILTLSAIGPDAKDALPELKKLAEGDPRPDIRKLAAEAVKRIEAK